MLDFTFGQKIKFFKEMLSIKLIDSKLIDEFYVDWEVDLINNLLEFTTMLVIQEVIFEDIEDTFAYHWSVLHVVLLTDDAALEEGKEFVLIALLDMVEFYFLGEKVEEICNLGVCDLGCAIWFNNIKYSDSNGFVEVDKSWPVDFVILDGQ